MKLNSLPVLCLSLLLFHAYSSLAKGRGSSSGKASSPPKKYTPSQSNTHSNTGSKNNQGSSSKGANPKQPAQTNYGKPGYQGNSYNKQRARMHYPAHGSAYGGAHGSRPGFGGPGGYPGGYVNHNPNNKILSPRYGGSFGYGGYGAGRGSPFSHSVQSMGVYPNDKSRGFGRTAVLAAGGGAVGGMAVGYGLGRFPRPHFQFHSPREERYYNHYMYNKYGIKSTDTNDYSRDYIYSPPPLTFDRHMENCMKRNDILPGEKQKPRNATTTAAASNTTEANNTSTSNSTSTPAPPPPRVLTGLEARPEPPASQAPSDEDDDTVGIVEIGYPALIEQLKVRRCLERYMVYSADFLRREAGGVQGLGGGFQGLLAVATSTVLMLLNSNMLILLP